jgi:hypothetical protein
LSSGRAASTSGGRAKILAVARSCAWHLRCTIAVTMVLFFEDDEDPKKPRPVDRKKKRAGWMERGEACKDNDLDHHRHVHVRC